jgi:hypothetical protein
VSYGNGWPGALCAACARHHAGSARAASCNFADSAVRRAGAHISSTSARTVPGRIKSLS